MPKILKFTQNLDYYLKLIDTRTANGDLLGALDASRRALEHTRTRVDRESINILIGQIYFEMGLYQLSCEHFFRAVRIGETRGAAFFGIGRNLVKMHESKLALEYFEATLNTDSAEDFSGAVLEWAHEIKEQLKGTPQPSIVAVAKNLVKMRKFSQAIMMLESVNPRTAEVQCLLADIMVLTEKYDSAREILFEVLRNEPNSIEANLVLCSLCYAVHDFPNLETVLQKVEGCPLDLGQLVFVGNMYANMSQYEKAISYYERALKLDEYNIKILLFLAISNYNINNQQEALYYIGQARWVDIENATLNIYYDIFARELVPPPLAVVTRVPPKIAENKLKSVFGAIDNGAFCDSFNRSLLFADDVEWCFVGHERLDLGKLANALTRCRKKKAVKLYNKLMLSVRLNREQKFYLTKSVILNESVKVIDLTANFRYRSFRVKIPSAFAKNSTLKAGYASAISYAELHGMNVNFEKIAEKLIKNRNFPTFPPDFDEKVLACLFFCENTQILSQACIYFGVDNNVVVRAINEFQLLI